MKVPPENRTRTRHLCPQTRLETGERKRLDRRYGSRTELAALGLGRQS